MKLGINHNVYAQRNLNSPLVGMNTGTEYLDAAVGVQGLAQKQDIARNPMGIPVRKAEEATPPLPGMKF